MVCDVKRLLVFVNDIVYLRPLFWEQEEIYHLHTVLAARASAYFLMHKISHAV